MEENEETVKDDGKEIRRCLEFRKILKGNQLAIMLKS